ncbi:hypothetical protein [Streptomyces roseochromogenus]|uniref:Uncharacterized protein n=1 Tax=Streptomyces roseochromogenus subsp. oscitans DS 12.976 TaxID=1352936 RepID=V6KBI8_STRRC|nr:hypothetical protein [Streptomyces roseochromogenus]EST29472.1 hypothetical protein M878_20565 [Streptomyces roseochromogenus subsp. oscitans DS 12.976]
MGKGGESSISDEEWERFVREAEAGTRPAPEEPSARARMVAARLREQPGRPDAWRSHEPPRRRAGRARYVAGLVVAAGLLVVALNPGRVTGWFGSGGEGGKGAGTPLAVESKRPDQPPPTEAASQLPTLAQPFRGSPAARWGDGAAGIGMPAARATGWMSKLQVAQALRRSRDFLVASDLDPGVLRGERPEKAIALINPRQRDVQGYLTAAFRAPSRKNDPLLLFSRFDKAKVRLVGDVVKTRGRITYREGERGAVEVTADVTFVYPVARATAGGDDVERTIVRRELIMSWDDPAKVITEPGTFSLLSYKSDTTNGGCGTYTGYLSPEFGTESASATPDDGPTIDPYDRSTAVDAGRRGNGDTTCGTATRS